jgi:hypothetical protein
MKFSAQIELRPKNAGRERFSNEKGIISFFKGLFIKKQVHVIEETLSNMNYGKWKK